MPFKFGGWELILILAIVLIIFGAGRLPEIGGAMGKAIRSFKRSSEGEDEPKPKAKRGRAKAKTEAKETSKAK
ncbi:MAG: twin-arginine translocase TatA/TatE family subunit [Chloroflexi bacterium]|nr:twin-arginine translocase TatA/TatE family subunit [Chloroflexota bacterium]